MMQFLVVLGATVAVCFGQYDLYGFDYDEPFDDANALVVECGNQTDQKMHVVYRGDASKVYCPADPVCIAVEIEPANFVFDDILTDPNCNPTKTIGLEMYTMEIVVQGGHTRQWTDDTHMITCNYEMGDKQQSSAWSSQDGSLVRIPQMNNANPNVPQSVITLELYNTRRKPITSAAIGSYVQLVATMVPAEGEVSFRPWSCKAFSNATGVYSEHSILLQGCGDGQVIKANRGFFTSGKTVIRTSRSVYFRVFALMGSSTLQFECDYAVTTDTSGDGPSCRKSKTGRRRRSVAMETTLTTARTGPISLYPREHVTNAEPAHTIGRPAQPSIGHIPEDFTYVPSERAANVAAEKPSSVCSEPAMIAMIAGIAILALVLVMLTVVTVVMCVRQSRPVPMKLNRHFQPVPGYNSM